METTRRGMLVATAASAALPAVARAAGNPIAQLPFDNGARELIAYPQKRPLLRLTARPPQLETPFSAFDESVLTPNDAFFVRYHHAGLPFDELDLGAFRLSVGGHVERTLSLSLTELQRLPKTQLVAVNQCSGNGRGFSQPRVPGGQAGNGLMGNARWTGVPLRAVLERAGVKPGAVQVQFAGLDRPTHPATPAYSKALNLDHAMDGEVMLAWDMNGDPLPLLNGFPLRLVVPGVYGTYWIKHLSEITVLDHVLDNFWMSQAYRIPDNACACTPPGQPATSTRPIGRYNVRSFITNLSPGARVAAARPFPVRGIAFDGGSGIAAVELSVDGGRSWRAAELGLELSRYAFRPWSAAVTLPAGPAELRVRATSRRGETQPDASRWNPSGYMRNGTEVVQVEAA